MRALAEKFHARFQGLNRAYGKYIIPKQEPGKEKVKGIATTEPGEPTVELWIEHLEGRAGLGIVPIMDGDVCLFGAIDIDVYDLDLKKLAQDVAGLELPLIVCRTKSGGAHLYMFGKDPIPAPLVRGKLLEWAVLLGHSGCEVFPKQTKLASPRDMGNWINMPYHGGARSVRYALNAKGEALAMEDFLQLASRKAISHLELVNFQREETDIDELLLEAPPCLQTLARRGFPEGMRNSSLYSIGVYLKKRYQDSWEQNVDPMNQRFMDPPLGFKEVATITKSLAKKNYQYKCNEHPLLGVCNRNLCLTRQYGVGVGNEDPGVIFGDLVKVQTDPPLWIMGINSRNVEFTTAELMDQGRAHARIIEVCNIWPFKLKPAQWRKLIQEKLEKADVVAVPIEATEEGQVKFHLQEFASRRATGDSMEDMLRGVAYIDQEKGRMHFRGSDFMEYLKKHYGKSIDEKRVFKYMRRWGVHHDFAVLKGRGVNYWWIELDDHARQTEPFRAPSVADGEEV